MDLSIVKLFPDNLAKALGNTLIHSLWQGLVLAAITGLIIVCTRKSSPVRRYNLLLAALVLFTAGIAATFLIELKPAPTKAPAPIAYNVAPAHIEATGVTTHVIQDTAFTDKAIGYFNKNANTIVLIWFLIVCARSLQLITGLQGIYYLRRRNIFKIDKIWEDKVAALCTKLGVRRVISIAESGMAKVPMVIGHLKPLILIPIGLLSAMSEEEIEAIIIHELAHIRRADYLVNLLQSLLEIVFFFNPAVLWISALLKSERENCCDDIAIAQSSNKISYIKALVSCQEYNLTSPAYAMALNGRRGNLKERVKRILSNNNQSLNRIEKSLLAICLVTAGLFTVAFTNAAKINKLVANTTKAVAHASNVIKKEILPVNKQVKAPTINTLAAKPDTAKEKLKIFSNAEIGNNTSFLVLNSGYITRLYKEKGTLYQMNYLNKALVSMQVDGKNVPDGKIPAYQPVFDRMPHDSHTEYGEVHDAADEREHAIESAHDANTDFEKRNDNSTDSAKTRLQIQNYKLGALGKLNGKAGSDGALDEQTSNYLTDSVNQAYKKSTKEYKKSAMEYKKSAMAPNYSKTGSYLKMPIDFKSYVVPKADENGGKMINKLMKDGMMKDNERTDKMIGELMTDGIIQSKSNLSFKISTSDFIVNGKKQPDAVYQKYKAKFVKNTTGEWSWMYNYDDAAKRTTSSITDEPKH